MQRFFGGSAAATYETGIANSIAHDRDSAGTENVGVVLEFRGKDDGESHAIEERVSDFSLKPRGAGRNPVAETYAVPVQDHAVEEGTTERQHEPVAVQRRASTGRRYIIEAHAAVLQSKGESAEAGAEHEDHFSNSPPADLGGVAREPGVDVMNLQPGCRERKTVEQRLHHQALAVDRRWRVGENEELHLGLECDAARERVRRT